MFKEFNVLPYIDAVRQTGEHELYHLVNMSDERGRLEMGPTLIVMLSNVQLLLCWSMLLEAGKTGAGATAKELRTGLLLYSTRSTEQMLVVV